ncbi:hypothetical protein Ahy_B01g053708 [Arachis hypogaea]|uniref:Uncharacterized protein n=1 Tax=Arachis hypogaea TaxID=3818 RepID=A0A445ASH4_ARAHY|nr:hypothetical protein Ahy_B01g053708 [Arachis hypogaea]
MDGASHVLRSSSCSSSTRNWTRTSVRTRPEKVPEWCRCGCRPILRWSGIERHPNKSFLGVLIIIGKKWCELFVWADSEQEDVVWKAGDEEGELKMNLAWRLRKVEAIVRTQKVLIQAMCLMLLLVVIFVLMLLFKV